MAALGPSSPTAGRSPICVNLTQHQKVLLLPSFFFWEAAYWHFKCPDSASLKKLILFGEKAFQPSFLDVFLL